MHAGELLDPRVATVMLTTFVVPPWLRALYRKT